MPGPSSMTRTLLRPLKLPAERDLPKEGGGLRYH